MRNWSTLSHRERERIAPLPKHCRLIRQLRGRTASAGLLAALLALSGTSVRAQTAQASPPPPSGASAGLSINLANPFPADFHFSGTLQGYYFKPGEHVTVGMQGVTVPSVTATANSSGAFSVPVSYTWVFCGARGASKSPPIFTAIGEDGSTARFDQAAQPCPLLVSQPSADAQLESPTGPQLVTFTVEGFGFAPGEVVTLQEPAAVEHPAASSTSAVADANGTIQAQVHAYLPPPCTMWQTPPSVEAVGAKGTSVLSVLNWWQVSMMGCPPPGTPAGGGTPTPGSAGTSQTSSPAVSLQLAHASVKRGRVQQALVKVDEPGHLKLTIRYANRRSRSLTATLSAAGSHLFRWRIPRTTHAGVARITVRMAANNPPLSARFKVH